jgi:hypothetical protein
MGSLATELADILSTVRRPGDFFASGRMELLTEIAPGIKRAGFIFNPDTGPYARLYFLPSFEAAARSLNIADRGVRSQRCRN